MTIVVALALGPLPLTNHASFMNGFLLESRKKKCRVPLCISPHTDRPHFCTEDMNYIPCKIIVVVEIVIPSKVLRNGIRKCQFRKKIGPTHKIFE